MNYWKNGELFAERIFWNMKALVSLNAIKKSRGASLERGVDVHPIFLPKLAAALT